MALLDWTMRKTKRGKQALNANITVILLSKGWALVAPCLPRKDFCVSYRLAGSEHCCAHTV